jgi:hypothetical protein
MPRTASGKDRVEIPSTIERSDAHARRLWKKAHDSAVETYGGRARASRRVRSAQARVPEAG